MKANDFKDFLRVAKKHSKGNKVYITDNLLFSGQYVSMFNFENNTQVRVKVGEAFPVPFMVNLVKFDKIISKLGANGVVEFIVSDKVMTLQTNKGSFSFEMDSNVKDFPAFDYSFKKHTVFSVKETETVKRLSNYVANDDMRPAMTNVLIDERNFVATDAHAILFPQSEKTREGKMLIPGHIAKELFVDSVYVGVFAESKYKRYIQLSQPNGIDITFRECESNFPAWENVIPHNNPNSFTVDGKELLSIMEVGRINSGAGGKFVFKTLGQDSLKISTGDADLKCGFETQIASANIGAGVIGFNDALLTKILKTERLSKVMVEIDDSLRGAVINGYIVLMPMVL